MVVRMPGGTWGTVGQKLGLFFGIAANIAGVVLLIVINVRKGGAYALADVARAVTAVTIHMLGLVG